MKRIYIWFLTLLIIGLGACEKEDTSIKYPDTGNYGDNILRMDSIDIQGTPYNHPYPYHYSMYAELPDETSVVIWINNTSTISDANWSFELSSKAGWIIIDYVQHKQKFVATGPLVCDLELTFYTEGSADIEIYENGSEEPTRIKTIYWHY